MVKGTIDKPLEAKRFHARVVLEASKSAKHLASEMADVHEDLIDSGEAPVGQQKKNNPQYAKSKGNKPPLYKTGVFKDAKRQRIRENSKDRQVDLMPPRERGVAFGVTRAQGYKSVYTDIPDGATEYERYAQGIVDDFVDDLVSDDQARRR